MVWLDAHCTFCVGYLALSFLCTTGEENVILMYYHHLFPFQAYLQLKSDGHYYLLGLKYSEREKKWKWINDMEHRTDM